ncbi:MAG TPA: hypothetical protein VFV50_13290 [Bdellovibrionales bacterium]|nr:hypothetical protein [Bdellovibrionales bacterium]
MKYVSLLLIVFSLAFTWRLAHHSDPIPVKLHHELQTAVTDVIKSAVTQQLPDATNFHFSKMYTQTINENAVQTFFGYTFNEKGESEETERNITGTALLTRDPADQTKWVLEDIRVDQSAIEFQEGTIIKPGEEGQPL